MSQLAVVVPPELAAQVNKEGLDQNFAALIATAFAPHYQDAQLALESAKAVAPTQPKKAGAARLELKRVRCAAEDTRKKLKAGITLQGRAVDGANAFLLCLLKPTEEAMEAIERAEELAEAARKSELAARRRAELGVYADTTHYNLAEMPEAQYQTLLENAKTTYNEAKAHSEAARIEAEAKAAEAKAAAAAKAAADEAERAELRKKAEAAEAETAAVKAALATAQEETRKANVEAWRMRQAAAAAATPAQAPVQTPATVAVPTTDKAAILAYCAAVLAVEIAPCTTTEGKELAKAALAYQRLVMERLAAKASAL